MLVTIYTDASIKKNGKATYAFRAKSLYGTLTGKGLITDDIGRSTNRAEHFAIRTAIKKVMTTWTDSTVYFINTDSLRCCETYWNLGGIKKGGRSKDIIKEAKKVVKYFKEKNLEIRLKHIKAHTGKSDTRSWLNNWCDQNT